MADHVHRNAQTLGQAPAAQVQLIVWCKGCWHRADPDVSDQVARYGADTTVPDWARRLHCSACEGPESISCRLGDAVACAAMLPLHGEVSLSARLGIKPDTTDGEHTGVVLGSALPGPLIVAARQAPASTPGTLDGVVGADPTIAVDPPAAVPTSPTMRRTAADTASGHRAGHQGAFVAVGPVFAHQLGDGAVGADDDIVALGAERWCTEARRGFVTRELGRIRLGVLGLEVGSEQTAQRRISAYYLLYAVPRLRAGHHPVRPVRRACRAAPAIGHRLFDSTTLARAEGVGVGKGS
jgi:hypothetical protein